MTATPSLEDAFKTIAASYRKERVRKTTKAVIAFLLTWLFLCSVIGTLVFVSVVEGKLWPGTFAIMLGLILLLGLMAALYSEIGALKINEQDKLKLNFCKMVKGCV